MTELIVYRAKPNPAGKDKSRFSPIPRQLQGEWIDIQNSSGRALRLTGISIDHRAFGPNCSDPQYASYWRDTEGLVLNPTEILRVHTGNAAQQDQMADEDRRGANKHRWGEHGVFQLNNGRCGDILTIWLHNGTWNKLDEVGYSPYPPEGTVLRRQGDRLVPVLMYAGEFR